MSWKGARRAAAVAFVAAVAHAAAAAPGVLWESRVTLEMDGMAMPAQTQRVCLAEGGTPEPMAGPDGDCRVEEARRSGNRLTWKVVCTGDEPMTGEGEMTFSADAWSGSVTLRSADGPMKMATRGRKLGGKCEARAAGGGAEPDPRVAAARRRAEAAQGQAEAATCEAAVSSMDVSFLTGKDAVCSDRAALGRVCARIDTREGFARLGDQDEPVRRRTLATCKKDLESVRRRLCKASMDEAPGRDAVDFLGRHCPDEVGRLAKRECAGRDFTGLDREWVPFCSRHARELMAAEAAKKEAKKKATDAAVSEGKKALKGLFRF